MINKEITHQISMVECLTKYPHLNPNNIIEMYVKSIEKQWISVGLLIDNNKVMTITIPIDYYHHYVSNLREDKINELFSNKNKTS
jgi:hypothetical protein